MIRRSLVVALLALTACAPRYVSPTRQDAAGLVLLPPKVTTSYVHLSGFADGRRCRTQLRFTGFGGLKERMSVRVAPGEEFTVLASFVESNYHCDVAVSFLPKARGTYAAVMDGTARGCRMTIARAEGKGWAPEPSMRKRTWKQPLLSNSESQCSN